MKLTTSQLKKIIAAETRSALKEAVRGKSAQNDPEVMKYAVRVRAAYPKTFDALTKDGAMYNLFFEELKEELANRQTDVMEGRWNPGLFLMGFLEKNYM